MIRNVRFDVPSVETSLSFWNIQILYCVNTLEVFVHSTNHLLLSQSKMFSNCSQEVFSKMWTLTHSICSRANQTCTDSMYKKRLWKITEGFLDTSPYKFTRAKNMSLIFVKSTHIAYALFTLPYNSVKFSPSWLSYCVYSWQNKKGCSLTEFLTFIDHSLNARSILMSK